MPLDHLLFFAGLYFLALAVGLWWLGIRSFLRRFSAAPSRRWWGPAVVEDYLQARGVARRLRWTPFRVHFFELLVVVAAGLLGAGALMHFELLGG